MNKRQNIQLLGQILQEAGLISKSQLDVALYDLTCYQEMRIGEILASRGWIKSATADFFAEEWQQFIHKKAKYPLGFYFQKAALINHKQIELILQEQPRSLVRFGSLAVIKGWIKQETLNFFLDYLFPHQVQESPFIKQYIDPITLIKQPQTNSLNFVNQKELDCQKTIVDEIDYEDIPWID